MSDNKYSLKITKTVDKEEIERRWNEIARNMKSLQKNPYALANCLQMEKQLLQDKHYNPQGSGASQRNNNMHIVIDWHKIERNRVERKKKERKQRKEENRKKMKEKFKEFMVGAFGAFGIILYYIVGIALWLITLMPIVFLDLPLWGYFVLVALTLIPFTGEILLLILWCITFPTVIGESFSTFICLYYIGLATFVLTYVIPTILSIIEAITNSLRK